MSVVCLNASGTKGAECSEKVENEIRVIGAIKSLVNARDLQLGVLESCIE